MKKHKLNILGIIIVIVTIFSLGFSVSAAPETDYSDDYYTNPNGVNRYEIYDNIVYQMLGQESEPYYNIISFVPNEKVADEVTEINIPTEINGVPVKTIENFSFFRFKCPNVKKIIIPEGITMIGEYTFKGMINVEEIILPDSLEEIGERSFINLTKLKKIVIPEKVTIIPYEAFYWCIGLESVEFKGAIRVFGDGAFRQCKSLGAIDCSGAEYIGAYAFYNCEKITEFKFSENLKSVDCGSFGKTSIEAVTIPSKTEFSCSCDDERGRGPFVDCRKLKTVIFEDVDMTQRREKRVYIPQNTFENCTALEKVVLPSNYNKISVHQRAFKKCWSLKTIVNFKNVSEIGESAFAYCDSLKSAKGIGAVIGDKAFLGCLSLKTVTLDSTRNKKASIGERAFENCTSLEKLTLPGKSITIGYRAFKKCTSLSKVYNSEKISSIDDAAFAYCKSLKEITLSNKVTEVDDKAFLGCSKLKRVVIENTKEAPDFDKKAFSSTPDGIKFITKNATVARSVKAELKGTGAKNARVYIKTSTSTKRV